MKNLNLSLSFEEASLITFALRATIDRHKASTDAVVEVEQLCNKIQIEINNFIIENK